MHKSGKYIGIIIGILILVVLSSGCVAIGGSFQDLSDNSGGLAQVSAVNGTYSVDNVSFKCPDNWHVRTDNEDMILVSPENSANPFYFISFAPIFQVQIIPNSDFSNYYSFINNSDDNSSSIMMGGIIDGQSMPVNMINGNSSNYTGTKINNSISEQEIVNIMRNGSDPSWNKISNSTIIIDNKTAYVDTFIVNSLMPPIVDKKFEQIVFVKNNKTYLFLLQAQDWDFDKEKQNFDIILNSFKVQ